MIKTLLDLQIAASASAIAVDSVPLSDPLKTEQARLAAFVGLGIDDSNYNQFSVFFNQARAQAAQRIQLRTKPILTPAPAPAATVTPVSAPEAVATPPAAQ